MQLVFNELSRSNNRLSVIETNKLISEFLHTYSAILKAHPSFSRCISTTINLNDLEICPGYYMAQWRNSNSVDREEKRRFLDICEKQHITLPSCDDFYVEYSGMIGIGLQIAFENQSPLISFQSSPDWTKSTLDCQLYDLENDEQSEITLLNISSEDNIKAHNAIIEDSIKKEYVVVKTPQAFLMQYEELFPSLYFHPNALSQMKNQINPVSIPVIMEKLLVLENYFSKWDGKKFDLSAFPPRLISPESNETLTKFKDEHSFEWKGNKYIASLHMRYTGGQVPGRIYFYPDHKAKKGIVFSMYTKLPTVSNPKI